MAEKRINEIKLRVGDSLMLELSRISIIENRPIADMLHLIIQRYVYGHSVPNLEDSEGTISPSEGLRK